MFGMGQMGFGYGHGMGNNGTPINGSGMNGTPMNGGMNGMGVGPQEGMTPGARSTGESTGTGGTEGEKDPFLSLLEQLAENEHSRGGPSELDFFLGGGNS